jgi:hypothetical protein
MSAIKDQQKIIEYWGKRCKEIVQDRNNLTQDELEHVVSSIAKLKDEKLKNAVTSLIGWGDKERADLETFISISLELFRLSSPSRVREAARIVEIRARIDGADIE